MPRCTFLNDELFPSLIFNLDLRQMEPEAVAELEAKYEASELGPWVLVLLLPLPQRQLTESIAIVPESPPTICCCIGGGDRVNWWVNCELGCLIAQDPLLLHRVSLLLCSRQNVVLLDRWPACLLPSLLPWRSQCRLSCESIVLVSLDHLHWSNQRMSGNSRPNYCRLLLSILEVTPGPTTSKVLKFTFEASPPTPVVSCQESAAPVIESSVGVSPTAAELEGTVAPEDSDMELSQSTAAAFIIDCPADPARDSPIRLLIAGVGSSLVDLGSPGSIPSTGNWTSLPKNSKVLGCILIRK